MRYAARHTPFIRTISFALYAGHAEMRRVTRVTPSPALFVYISLPPRFLRLPFSFFRYWLAAAFGLIDAGGRWHEA